MACCGANTSCETKGNVVVEDMDKLCEILDKYKGQKGSLISILQDIQGHYDYLPVDALNYVSEVTGIKPAKIHGVATFYTQFRMTPIGKHLILLCQGTACHVNGSKAIEEAICEELGINEGETTEDNLFTLINVACLGCCSLSPVMMIGEDTYGKLTPKETKKILKDIREQEKENVEGA